MGEQGAKIAARRQDGGRHLRRHRRPPAARAGPRSALTIDNTDGALPIDYTEVTITRTMFRGGGSEYAINGTSCRLLDVQELLLRLRASGARCTSSSGRASSTRCCGRRPRSAAASSRRRPACSSTAAARSAPCASSRRWRPTSPGCRTSPVRSAASSDRWGARPRPPDAPRVVQADVRDARLRLLADDLVAAHRPARAGGRRRDGPRRAAHGGRGRLGERAHPPLRRRTPVRPTRPPS